MASRLIGRAEATTDDLRLPAPGLCTGGDDGEHVGRRCGPGSRLVSPHAIIAGCKASTTSATGGDALFRLPRQVNFRPAVDRSAGAVAARLLFDPVRFHYYLLLPDCGGDACTGRVVHVVEVTSPTKGLTAATVYVSSSNKLDAVRSDGLRKFPRPLHRRGRSGVGSLGRL